MGPIWGRQDPGGPHVGPMKLAIWGLVGWVPFLLPFVQCWQNFVGAFVHIFHHVYSKWFMVNMIWSHEWIYRLDSSFRHFNIQLTTDGLKPSHLYHRYCWYWYQNEQELNERTEIPLVAQGLLRKEWSITVCRFCVHTCKRFVKICVFVIAIFVYGGGGGIYLGPFSDATYVMLLSTRLSTRQRFTQYPKSTFCNQLIFARVILGHICGNYRTPASHLFEYTHNEPVTYFLSSIIRKSFHDSAFQLRLQPLTYELAVRNFLEITFYNDLILGIRIDWGRPGLLSKTSSVWL